MGIDALWSSKDRTIGPVVVGAALVLALVTVDVGPGDLQRPPDRSTRWVTWLDDHPGGAVVALPPAPGQAEEDFEATTAAMVQSLEHGHPLVNGYSGFFPDRDEDLRARLERFPEPTVLAELRDLGVDYAVADPSWWTDQQAADARSLGLRILSSDPTGILLDLRGR